MEEKSFKTIVESQIYFDEVFNDKTFFGELFIYDVGFGDNRYLVTDKDILNVVVQSKIKLTKRQELENKFPYLNQLERDLRLKDNFKLLNDEIDFCSYLKASDVVESFFETDLLNEISNREISDYLEDNGYLVYNSFDDLCRCLDKREIKELAIEKGVELEKPLFGLTGTELYRHICDIVGCGYHQYNQDDLVNELKKLI